MTKAPERVETSRLVLRRPRLEDAQCIFERYAGDLEVTRFLSWPRHESAAETLAFLRWSDAEWERWPAGPYVILSRAGEALLGGTGLAFETRERAATGYVLARDAWGLGYATEALSAIVPLAKELGVRRLHALCHPEHVASSRVLEKCDFRREETARSEFPNLQPGVSVDTLCFARIP